MRQTSKFPRSLRLTALAAAALATGHAQAMDFEAFDGWQGYWNTTIAVSQSWRARSADPGLYTFADGSVLGMSNGTGGTNNSDSGDLNYGKGDTFSQVLKFTTELSLHKNDTGAFIRVKGWYDNALINGDVKFGSEAQPTPYTRGGKLSDAGLKGADRFSGVLLQDAYVYTTFDLGDHPLQVKVGNQVLNWGESLFTLGINHNMPLDLGALNRGAGTEVKEFLIPVPLLYGNLGLSGGSSVEAYWQFGRTNTVVPGCGQFMAQTESAVSPTVGACDVSTTLPLSTMTTTYSTPFDMQNGLYMPMVDGPKPSKDGQFGAAFRMPVDAIDTEFGLYAEQFVPRTPIVSGNIGVNQASAAATGGVVGATQLAVLKGVPIFSAIPALAPYQALYGISLQSGSSFWEYPGHTKLLGLSASTTLAGWSTGAELSYQKDVPAQINGNDLVQALVGAAGPVATQSNFFPIASKVGNIYHGYNLFNVSQFQVNAVKLFSGFWGSQNLTIAAEFAMQSNNLPDYKQAGYTGLRYGRAFIFGFGATSTIPAAATGNTSATGMQNDGYDTRFADGINVLAKLDYSDVFESGFDASPSIYLKRDLSGYSIDSQFVQDRTTIAFGLKLDYHKKFAIDLGFTTYNHNAAYDPMRDRDFYSVGLSTQF